MGGGSEIGVGVYASLARVHARTPISLVSKMARGEGGEAAVVGTLREVTTLLSVASTTIVGEEEAAAADVALIATEAHGTGIVPAIEGGIQLKMGHIAHKVGVGITLETIDPMVMAKGDDNHTKSAKRL